MSWKICNSINWEKFISSKKLYSFYNIEDYSKINKYEKWEILYLLNYKNNTPVSGCKLCLKSKFKIKIIYLPGGIEGEINAEVIDSLASFLKNYFGFFFVSLIDLHQKYETNIKSQMWKKLYKKYFKTVYKNLDIDAKTLSSTFSKNFRHNVKRSNKYNLKTRINCSPNIEEILNLHLNMKNFKNLPYTFTLNKLKNNIKLLNKNCICFETRKDNILISFRAIIIHNDVAWDYLAFTSQEGRKIYASYNLINFIFEYCIRKNIKVFDLSGIDKINNIGVYNFKIGTGGEIYHRLGHLHYAPLFFLKYLFTIFYALKY
mgnify:CR=1 FL=1|tara:strand:- start:1085 stop:2035 length:951 start_codon:yes stop_codon:yes gene_type:complete